MTENVANQPAFITNRDRSTQPFSPKPVKLASTLLLLLASNQPSVTNGFAPRSLAHRAGHPSMRDTTALFNTKLSEGEHYSDDFRGVDRKYGLIAKAWVQKLGAALEQFNAEHRAKPDIHLDWREEHGQHELVLKGSRHHEPSALRFLVKNLLNTHTHFYSKNLEDYSLELSNDRNPDNDFYIDFVHLCNDQVYSHEKRLANLNHNKLMMENLFLNGGLGDDRDEIGFYSQGSFD